MLLQFARATRHTTPVLVLQKLCVAFSSDATAATPNHYQVLGVDRSAGAAEIKKAFRKRAKVLHPDLNSTAGQEEAQQDFLRLVAAYEVLSDAQQRRLYDTATDTQVPRAVRRAAARQQAAAAAGAASHTEPDDGSPLNWRWGMADWAQYGPAPPEKGQGQSYESASASAGAGGQRPGGGGLGLQLSVLSALSRHRRDLEAELHAALLTAFLGPRLELKVGELPAAFELDERAHPSLTDDLLHLVHGRTLLGVVQTPHTLSLAGGTEQPAQLPGVSSSTLQLQQTPSLLGSAAPPGPHAGSSTHTQVTAVQPCMQQGDGGPATEWQVRHSIHQQQQATAAAAAAAECAGDERATVAAAQDAADGCASAEAAVGAADQHASSASASTAGFAEEAAYTESDSRVRDDAEIGDKEWRALLQKQQPLLGSYAWRLQPHAAEASQGPEPQQQQQQQPVQVHRVAVGSVPASGQVGDSTSTCDQHHQHQEQPVQQQHEQQQQQQQQQQHTDEEAAGQAAAAAVSASAATEAPLGGRAAREAWEQQHEGMIAAAAALHAHHLTAPTDIGVGSEQEWDSPTHAPGSPTTSSREYNQSQASTPAAAGEVAGRQQQQQQLSWQQQWRRLDPAGQVQMQQQWLQQWRQQQEQLQQQRWGNHHDCQPQSLLQRQQQRQPEGTDPHPYSGKQQEPPVQQQQQQQQQQEGSHHHGAHQQQRGSHDHHQHHHQQHQGLHHWHQQQQQQQEHDDAHRHHQHDQEHQHHNTHQQQRQQQHNKQHHHQQQQQQRRRPGHRRLWRWLRNPTPDWQAADWSFSDQKDGVLVLELMQDGGGVAAVLVRDDTQPNKPTKVYVDGVLYAAVLDDVVMQPLTGKLMAVLYRYSTPGVHHLYFYLPNTQGASRVLAKMLRRWMPPSSTWLFPPRSELHDRCSWSIEWEGFGAAQQRPGWLHPAVYVLTAACYSYDMECRRLKQRGASYEWLWQSGSQAFWAASEAWATCRKLLSTALHKLRSVTP